MGSRAGTFVFAMLLALPACSGSGGGGEIGDDDGSEATDATTGDGAEGDGGAAEDGDGAPREDGAGEDGGADEATTCSRTTDPLTLWRERAELNLVGSGPLTRLGTLDGPCVVDGYRVVAAGGMALRFEAATEATGMVTARLALYDARAFGGGTVAPLAEGVGAPGFTALLDATIPAGGEYLLLVHDLELRDEGPYALSVSCRSGCGKRATRFPIVLLHGFGGWDTILGSLEYFYGVEDELEAQGYDVWVPISDAVNDTPTRARQYAEQIDEILATTHARKVNFITHSQGGLDARYIVSTLDYGDRAGAVVMISTPNDGTMVADALLGDLARRYGAVRRVGAILAARTRTRGGVRAAAHDGIRDEFTRQCDDPRVVLVVGRAELRGPRLRCQAATRRGRRPAADCELRVPGGRRPRARPERRPGHRVLGALGDVPGSDPGRPLGRDRTAGRSGTGRAVRSSRVLRRRRGPAVRGGVVGEKKPPRNTDEHRGGRERKPPMSTDEHRGGLRGLVARWGRLR